MFSNFWVSKATDKRSESSSRKNFSDSDDHPDFTESFVVDSTPLPEQTSTEKYANFKNMFNRSYIEAATVGAGSIALITMILKYRKD